MSNYVIKKIDSFEVDGIRNLFLDAGWEGYIDRIEKMSDEVAKNSLSMIGAYIDEQIVGFVRVVGDGQTIVFIQDLIVLKSFKRKGIGRALVNYVLERYKRVRQKVLITDNNEEATGFYKSIGLKDAKDMGIVAFLKFDE